jgi:NAD(P)-dependent dehydrogenase (short-subunit alcohol dehydrogenase family)
MPRKTILITGSSSGFGRMSAEALGAEGHTVYASMRAVAEHNAPAAAELASIPGTDIRPLELDIQSEASVEAAINTIMRESGRIDVLVHNAGHMVFGPAEAFTPEQYAELYDINVIGAHRVNRAALPHMRAAGAGLLVWVSSSSVAGGVPPYLAPYFAAKAAMDSLAAQYARELARWGIETTIVVPGAFPTGTNHFAHSGRPADTERQAEYDNGPYADVAAKLHAAIAETVPADADPAMVARRIAEVVAMPDGKRPFRVTYDPAQDGGEVALAVIDRLRAEMLRRIGLSDLLTPRFSATPVASNDPHPPAAFAAAG